MPTGWSEDCLKKTLLTLWAYTEPTWVHSERGERNLTLQSLERLAEVIGVEPVELLS